MPDLFPLGETGRYTCRQCGRDDDYSVVWRAGSGYLVCACGGEHRFFKAGSPASALPEVIEVQANVVPWRESSSQ